MAERLTVPILNVHHVTTYRYRQPVLLGEHRMMFRPRDSHDQKLLESRLVITPEPVGIRWTQDVFGNSVSHARFSGRASELVFDSKIRLEHSAQHATDFTIEEHAEAIPFSYGAEEAPDLLRSVERQYADPKRAVDHWARRFLRRDGTTRTRELLAEMTHTIRRDFTYIAREERGTQDPATTLRLGSGTCRDFAVLMMEAARSLGLAARFVSGYLHSPGHENRRGGGATHAWLQIYLPGAGWVEFDPTNGIVGSRDLIRVAVVRDAAHAVPLSGTWTGFPSDSLGMTVSVSVTAEPEPANTAAQILRTPA